MGRGELRERSDGEGGIGEAKKIVQEDPLGCLRERVVKTSAPVFARTRTSDEMWGVLSFVCSIAEKIVPELFTEQPLVRTRVSFSR